MRVVDLGAGPGDVAFLVAEAVGSSGSVVGVDREERSVQLAGGGQRKSGYGNVTFAVAGDDALPADAPFDAVIGRFVLIHQREPAVMIRRAAAVVRPRGIVAFLDGAPSRRPLSPGDRARERGHPEFEAIHVGGSSEPGHRRQTIPCFIEAGLPEPKVLWESVVPGSKDDIWLRSFILTYKNLLPFMQRFGTVDPRAGDPNTLAQRIMADVLSRRAQGVTGPFASAWATKA